MKKNLFIISLSIFYITSIAQNIGIGTNTPNSSAILDVSSSNRGFLPPRLSISQRNALVNPTAGLMIYCTDCNGIYGEMQCYNGSDWMDMTIGTASNVPYDLPSVTIGTQVWGLKNLNVTNYRNGDPIPQVTNTTQWISLTTGAWCWYNNDSVRYAATYGRLYNWYAVNDPRGLAPNGWRIPNETDWKILTKFLDPTSDTTSSGSIQSYSAGGLMKDTGFNNWTSPNTGASNLSGFTGLPAGTRSITGSFGNLGTTANWWSSTSSNSNSSFCRIISNISANLNRSSPNKTSALSVRLIKEY